MFVIFCDFVVVGCGDEESAGEEHKIGEHVLEDLELGTEEEAGLDFWIFIFLGG